MIYSSLEFLVAFPVFAVIYWLLPSHRTRLVWLMLGSLAFYYYGQRGGITVLAAVIATAYVGGLLVQRAGRWQALVAAAAVLALVADLAFFKYVLFIASVSNLPIPHPASLIAPLGISFFTFEAIAYIVDIRRGVASADRDPLRVALFIAVFPHLIAGPIMRPNDFIPQLRRGFTLRLPTFVSGLQIFVEGLVKKRIADEVAPFADAVFASGAPSTESAWLAAIAYTVQIYGDFAGYTDMGRGVARMLGFELPLNFNGPYIAASIGDFWRRWHISLSSWIRDYVYISLGGNRKGVARTYVNLLVTMSLAGLWHGAGWTFVAWGAYHGVLLAIERAFPWYRTMPRALSVAITLFLVVNGWILFRAKDFGTFLRMMHAMYVPTAGPLEGGALAAAGVMAAFVAVIVGMIVSARRPDVLEGLGVAKRGLAYGMAGGAAVLLVLLDVAPAPFIYFRF